MDGWMRTSVHGSDPSLEIIHWPLIPPRSYLGATLWAELFQQIIKTTVANAQPEWTLQYWVVSGEIAIARSGRQKYTVPCLSAIRVLSNTKIQKSSGRSWSSLSSPKEEEMLPLKSFHWGLSFSHTLIFSCVRLGCNLFPTELFFNGGAFNGVNMYYTVLLACFFACTS